MPNSIEFWFDFASTYSYVAALRIERLCEAAGLNLTWKPFLLGPLFTEQLGIRDSPFNAYPIRGSYMWRDLERLCGKYSLPWRRPTSFPRNSVLAARVSCIASEEPWGGQFIRAIFLANFSEDLEIADPAVLADLLEMQGSHSKEILERAISPETKARLRAQTAEASRLGMFGAPNFIVSSEMFFGQDRLEDAIQWALAH
jgi:2-hydroxychromene-2-carboxylate isomerase